jgi:hypothetical protein
VPGETTTWLLTENLAHGVEHAVEPGARRGLVAAGARRVRRRPDLDPDCSTKC